jgi:hypothetical protein
VVFGRVKLEPLFSHVTEVKLLSHNCTLQESLQKESEVSRENLWYLVESNWKHLQGPFVLAIFAAISRAIFFSGCT